MGSKATNAILAFCGAVTIASVVGVIVVADKAASTADAGPTEVYLKVDGAMPEFAVAKPPAGENICEGKKVYLPNDACEDLNVPQAGANVTKGYKGDLNVTHTPITDEYFKNSMCPVNVHWHLGTEHLSVGEFDEDGSGPNMKDGYRRALAAGEEVRGGHRCHHYNANVEMFNKPYNWKHCVGMEVGETYEVHWPHSAAGACGTPNQYQTPFYDGVFCDQDLILNNLNILPEMVGVQAQIFTIVNDESYYYPDLMRGMIVDGEFGMDVAKYTGSTTGTPATMPATAGTP